MNYQKLLQEDCRLVILRLLAEATGYDLNSSIIQAGLAEFSHRLSRDKLHGELAWLEEQGLVNTREVRSVVVAELTARGADVASGAATVPGVKKPRPGE